MLHQSEGVLVEGHVGAPGILDSDLDGGPSPVIVCLVMTVLPLLV